MSEKFRFTVKPDISKVLTKAEALAADRAALTINLEALRLATPTRISMEYDVLFIGEYSRIVVTPGAGLTFDDLEFQLTNGADSGSISLCRDDLSVRNEIMLLAGWRPGLHELRVVRSGSSPVQVLAHKNYRITDVWNNDLRTPRHWSSGNLNDFVTGYTWGGGVGTPQNVNVIPASGTRRIILVFVDTTTARYPDPGMELTNIQTQWTNAIVGPQGSSTYWSEVSYNNYTLAFNGAPQLVHLGNSWDDNFRVIDGWLWTPRNTHAIVQAVISAIAGAVTPHNGDSLVMIIKSVTGTTPPATDKAFWPQAWGANVTIPGGSANIACLGMPHNWSGRTFTETVSHELGHNIGLPDLYTPEDWGYSQAVRDRNVGRWSLMSYELGLPHITLMHRLELGWIQAAWIRNFDFSRSTIPLDETIDLSPIEAIGAPGAGHFKGIEIRIADGWNYYFEYRRTQAGGIGDQALPRANVVFATDNVSRNHTAPFPRPQVLLLQGPRSAFIAGESYTETDQSSMAVADFRMDVISTDDTTARVRIRYGTNGRPDLYIRPWPGGNNWQSPDIEVRNARNAANPAWRNTPWVSHANTVVATYRNRGPVTCVNVTVSFYIKDFTVANAPEMLLGRDTKDVPPESVAGGVEFSTSWVPGNNGHKCIVVRTPLYADLPAGIVEVSDANNSAQSNYARYIAASASPAHRGITEVTLSNPFPVPAVIYTVPQITGTWANLYRLYQDQTSALLEPGESKKITVMLESLYGDEHFAADGQHRVKYFEDAQLTLTGYGLPQDGPHPVVLGGLQIAVGTGRKTKFSRYYASVYDGVTGTVITDRTPSEPAKGNVLLTFIDEETDHEATISAQLDPSGSFSRIPPFRFGKKTKVLFHYPGFYGYAPCDAAGPVIMRNTDSQVGTKVSNNQSGYYESSLPDGTILDDRDPALQAGLRGVTLNSSNRTPPGSNGGNKKVAMAMPAELAFAQGLIPSRTSSSQSLVLTEQEKVSAVRRNSSMYEAPVKSNSSSAFVPPSPSMTTHTAMTPDAAGLCSKH